MKIVLLLVLLPSICLGEQFRYETPFLGSENIVIDTESETLLLGDIQVGIRICPEKSEYICFSSEILGDISFAIPRVKPILIKSWVFSGQRFENYGMKSFQMFGRSFSAYVIRADYENQTIRYLYSFESGLMGVGRFDKKTKLGKTHWLTSKAGFGS